MPTKTTKPKWNADYPGYCPSRPLFGSDKVESLAAELCCSIAELQRPLSEAELAIGPFLGEWRSRPATEPEQRVALRGIADDAESALDCLRGMDRRTRYLLLKEYGAGGDSEGDACAAVKRLQNDIAALDRLHQNLVVAAKRLGPAESAPGAPRTDFERFAAEKLFQVSRSIYGTRIDKRGSERRAARRFVVAALMMLDIKQKTAAGAADAVLNGKKIPVPGG